MKITLPIKQRFEVDIDLDELAYEINELSLEYRFNWIGKFINNIEIEDVEKLHPEHKALIKDWLERQIIKFK